jgi:hypothetical protein
MMSRVVELEGNVSGGEGRGEEGEVLVDISNTSSGIAPLSQSLFGIVLLSIAAPPWHPHRGENSRSGTLPHGFRFIYILEVCFDYGMAWCSFQQ